MRTMIRWSWLAGLTVLGNVHAGGFDRLDFDRATQPPIKSVALLPLRESRSMVIRNSGSAASHASSLFLPLGLGAIVGIAAEQGADNDNTKKFVQAVNERKLGLAVPLANAIRAELLKNGMRFAYLTNQRVTLTEDKKDIDFNGVGTNADAIMVVAIGQAGYVSSALSTTYAPRAVVYVKIVDARTRNPIFARTYCTGCPDGTKDVELIPSDPETRFGSFDQIMGGLDKAVDGLRAEHRKIAARVIESIRPPGDVRPITAPAAEAAAVPAMPASGTQ